jgi:hypothetical protein
MIILGYCFRCANTGKISRSTDKIVPFDQETDAQAAMRMVEGGRWYEQEEILCPSLDKPKHRVLN